MTQMSHRLAELEQPQVAARSVAQPGIPREFDGIPGLRNSQALRDWARATADLDRAKQLHAAPETVTELSRTVARAYARLQALSVRPR